MKANTRNRTIALAAIFQCIELILQISTKGQYDEERFETCLESIVYENPHTIEDIYGGLSGLKTGLEILVYQLSSGDKDTPIRKSKDFEITRHGINILYLEQKLSRNKNVFERLLRGIKAVQQQLDIFELTHRNTIAKLADLYSTNISQLGPRIMIKGDQTHLGNPNNAAKIRAILLAGVRAALLWKQSGGSRWKLLFARRKMQKEAYRLLKQI